MGDFAAVFLGLGQFKHLPSVKRPRIGIREVNRLHLGLALGVDNLHDAAPLHVQELQISVCLLPEVGGNQQAVCRTAPLRLLLGDGQFRKAGRRRGVDESERGIAGDVLGLVARSRPPHVPRRVGHEMRSLNPYGRRALAVVNLYLDRGGFLGQRELAEKCCALRVVSCAIPPVDRGVSVAADLKRLVGVQLDVPAEQNAGMRLVERPEWGQPASPLQTLALQLVAPPDAIVARIPYPARLLCSGAKSRSSKKNAENCTFPPHRICFHVVNLAL